MSATETPTHNPCCSSHGVPMTCEQYRRTHFVEVRPCCSADRARLAAEGSLTEAVAAEVYNKEAEPHGGTMWANLTPGAQRFEQQVALPFVRATLNALPAPDLQAAIEAQQIPRAIEQMEEQRRRIPKGDQWELHGQLVAILDAQTSLGGLAAGEAADALTPAVWALLRSTWDAGMLANKLQTTMGKPARNPYDPEATDEH